MGAAKSRIFFEKDAIYAQFYEAFPDKKPECHEVWKRYKRSKVGNNQSTSANPEINSVLKKFHSLVLMDKFDANSALAQINDITVAYTNNLLSSKGPKPVSSNTDRRKRQFAETLDKASDKERRDENVNLAEKSVEDANLKEESIFYPYGTYYDELVAILFNKNNDYELIHRYGCIANYYYSQDRTRNIPVKKAMSYADSFFDTITKAQKWMATFDPYLIVNDSLDIVSPDNANPKIIQVHLNPFYGYFYTIMLLIAIKRRSIPFNIVLDTSFALFDINYQLVVSSIVDIERSTWKETTELPPSLLRGFLEYIDLNNTNLAVSPQLYQTQAPLTRDTNLFFYRFTLQGNQIYIIVRAAISTQSDGNVSYALRAHSVTFTLNPFSIFPSNMNGIIEYLSSQNDPEYPMEMRLYPFVIDPWQNYKKLSPRDVLTTHPFINYNS